MKRQHGQLPLAQRLLVDSGWVGSGLTVGWQWVGQRARRWDFDVVLGIGLNGNRMGSLQACGT